LNGCDNGADATQGIFSKSGDRQGVTGIYARYTVGTQTVPQTLPVGLYSMLYPPVNTSISSIGKAVACPALSAVAPNTASFFADNTCVYVDFEFGLYALVTSCTGGSGGKVTMSLFIDSACSVLNTGQLGASWTASSFDLTDMNKGTAVCSILTDYALSVVEPYDDVNYYADNNRRLTGTGGSSIPYGIAANLCTYSEPISLKALFKALCFAGSESVLLFSGVALSLSEVRVGDVVLAARADGSTVFSPVVAIPHAHNSVSAVFQHLTAESGRDIKLTPLHLIANGACGTDSFALVQASSVQAGSCLRGVAGEELVISNELVRGVGAYSLVTQEALVVVSGFVASPFSENHIVGHAYYSVHRAIALLAPGLLQGSWAKAANLAFGDLVTGNQ